MNYCKIRTDGSAQQMPNPFRLTIANPTEEQKATLAGLDGWLPMRYTEEPSYDPETQYLTYHWVEQDSEAVQVWEVHDIPEPPEGEADE